MKQTDNLSGFAGGGETRLDISSLDFSTSLSVTGTVGTTNISAASGDYSTEDDPAAAFAAALEAEIQNETGLSEATVSVSEDGTDLIINNPTDAAVNASFTVTDASGTPSNTASRATGGNIADDGGTDTIDISGLDLSTGGTITIGGSTTVNIPEDSNIGDVQGLLDSQLGADFTVTDDGNNTITITNPTGGAVASDPGTIQIADGTGEPNGTAGGSISTIAATDETSLAEKFESGQTYNFQASINETTYEFENIGSLNDLVSQVNAKSNETGIQANLNRSNDEIYFSSQFDEPFEVNIQADLDGNDSFDSTTETVQSVTATVEDNTTSMDKIDISTAEGADIAMIAVDYAIDSINGFRAELGAVQNRFESTIANLATTSENLSASNSRIRDADFAAESAELARTQVLQQAGMSVLSQANARPQQVLQLLQG